MSEKESREKKKEEEEKEWRVKGSVRAKCCRGEDRDPTAPALSQISAPNHRRRLSYPSLLRLCPLHSALHWRPRCQWWLTPVDSMLLLLLRWSTPWLLLPSYPLPVKFDSAIPCYDQTTVLPPYDSPLWLELTEIRRSNIPFHRYLHSTWQYPMPSRYYCYSICWKLEM